jgi:hypothetical protein
MPNYAAEVYTPRTEGDVSALAGAATSACRALAADGIAVHYLSSVLMPDDEVCIQLFAAESASVVEEVGRRAGLAFSRITEAVTTPIEGREDEAR